MRQVLQNVATHGDRSRYPGFAEVFAELLGQLDVSGEVLRADS